MNINKSYLTATYRGRPVFVEASSGDFITDAEVDVVYDNVVGSVSLARARCSDLEDIKEELLEGRSTKGR